MGLLKKKGIIGGHNRDNFLRELNPRGGRIKLDSNGNQLEIPGNTKGISSIFYEIPALDRARQVNGWKSIPYPKTVYNPNVISDEEILELSKKAALSFKRL